MSDFVLGRSEKLLIKDCLNIYAKYFIKRMSLSINLTLNFGLLNQPQHHSLIRITFLDILVYMVIGDRILFCPNPMNGHK